MSPFVEEFLNFYFKSMAGSGWTLNVSSEFVYMWTDGNRFATGGNRLVIFHDLSVNCCVITDRL